MNVLANKGIIMKQITKQLLYCGGLLFMLLQLSGCQTTMPQPEASIENRMIARTIEDSSAKVGDFKAAQNVDDTVISIRAHNLVLPVDRSFAQYLRQLLHVELEAANLLDQSSDKTISGTLTKSDLNSHGTGRGILAGEFTVIQNGQILYKKELEVQSTWESSFIAAIAVPDAIIQYEDLYRKLVGKLLSDPEFQQAIKK